MKVKLIIVLVALTMVANAQNAIPKSAIDIAPLLIGEKIPNTKVKTPDNVDVQIADFTKKKKTVLVVYRGGWCPYCNAHLQALAEAEKVVLDLGYQIIAISPDSPENLKITEEKDKVKYILLSDATGVFIQEMGLGYEAPQNYKSVINVHSNGMNTSLLPVPSLFVLNTDNEILFEYISPDFKHRITTDLLVAILKSLK